MTRATELEKLNNDNGVLVVIKPRRTLTASDFTLVSTGIYKTTFTLGRVIGFARADQTADPLPSPTEFTEAASSAVSAGEFYFDTTTSILYVGISAANLASNYMYCTYEIYTSTSGMHWYRVPTDSSSDTVYFEQTIINDPTISSSISDLLYGFLPIYSTNLTLSNVNGFYNEHLSDSSFRQCDIDVYHWLGSVDTTNMKRVLNAIGGNITYNQETIRINLKDRIDLLDRVRVTKTFTTTEFSAMDSSFNNSSVPEIFGYARGITPVCFDLVVDNPTETDNREWAVDYGYADRPSFTRTVVSSSDTATTTLNSVVGLLEGASIIFTRVGSTPGGQVQYKRITGVAQSTNTVGHEAISGNKAEAGDTFEYIWVTSVDLVRADGSYFNLQYGLHYSVSATSGLNNVTTNIAGFVLKDNIETAIGTTPINPQSDKIICTAVGKTTLPTISASPFGAVETTYTAGADGFGTTGVVTDPIMIIYSLLKEVVSESSINTSSFQSLYTSIGQELGIGFITPITPNENFQTYKEIILEILKTCQLRLFINTSGKWDISQASPLLTIDKTIQDDEIISNSLQYNFDYDDVYSRFKFNFRTSAEKQNITVTQAAFNKLTTFYESPTAKYLHLANKTLELNLLFMKFTSVDIIGPRYVYALGDRQGEITLQTKNRVYDTDIDSNIEIERDNMPGFAFVRDTLRSKETNLVDIKKNLKNVNLILNDQKGIEDNSDSW